MKVVADSHALLFYLFTPDQLSDPALEVLGDAENTDGIVVSAATLGDLWYASHKAGERGLAPGAFDLLRSTVVDPETRFEVAALDATTMDLLASFPLAGLPDPWDRLIVATAMQLDLPLVTRDRAIRNTGVAQTIW